jgi:hypothetical protein
MIPIAIAWEIRRNASEESQFFNQAEWKSRIASLRASAETPNIPPKKTTLVTAFLDINLVLMRLIHSSHPAHSIIPEESMPGSA